MDYHGNLTRPRKSNSPELTISGRDRRTHSRVPVKAHQGTPEATAQAGNRREKAKYTSHYSKTAETGNTRKQGKYTSNYSKTAETVNRRERGKHTSNYSKTAEIRKRQE